MGRRRKLKPNYVAPIAEVTITSDVDVNYQRPITPTDLLNDLQKFSERLKECPYLNKTTALLIKQTTLRKLILDIERYVVD